MTTILGIKTNTGKDRIVLFGDMQVNYELNRNGEKTRKTESDSKFRIAEDRHAILFTGNLDTQTEAFYSYATGIKTFEGFAQSISGRAWRKKPELSADPRVLLQRYKAVIRRNLQLISDSDVDINELVSPERELVDYLRSRKSPEEDKKGSSDFEQFFTRMYDHVLPYADMDPVERAVRTNNFWEFNMLNAHYIKREVDYDDMAELLIATASPSVELYRVDSLGNMFVCQDVSELEFFCLGSGSDNIDVYFSEEKYKDDPSLRNLKLDSIDIDAAIRLGRAMMVEASKDTATGENLFAELAVIEEEKIDFYGNDIRKALFDAYDNKIASITQKYLDDESSDMPSDMPSDN